MIINIKILPIRNLLCLVSKLHQEFQATLQRGYGLSQPDPQPTWSG